MNPDAPSSGQSNTSIPVIGSTRDNKPKEQTVQANTGSQQGYQYNTGGYQAGNYQYDQYYGNQTQQTQHAASSSSDQHAAYYGGRYDAHVAPHDPSRSTAEVHPYTENRHSHAYNTNAAYIQTQQQAPSADPYANYGSTANQYAQQMDSLYTSQTNPPPPAASTASYGQHIPPTQAVDPLYAGHQQPASQHPYVERVPSPSVDPLYNSDPIPEPASTYVQPSQTVEPMYSSSTNQPPATSTYPTQTQDPVYTSQASSQYPTATTASYSHQGAPQAAPTYSHYDQTTTAVSSAPHTSDHKTTAAETKVTYTQADTVNTSRTSSTTEAPKVSDIMLQLANKAMQSIQKISVKPQSPTKTDPEEPKVADKVMENRRLHFKVVRFMFEAGTKLRMQTVTLATACKVYHKMFKSCSPQHYDPYLIGTTCLYLAGKIEEDHMKLRDVINVCYSTLHPDRQPLDIGSTYWSLRETVTQCELFIMRMLQFRVAFIHPHKFLLHYLKSVLDLLPPSTTAKTPLATTAWALLRDSYHGDLCLRHDAEHIAVAALYLALQLYGVEVPLNQLGENTWWESLVEDLKLEEVRKIIRDMIGLYSMEVTAMVN